MKKSGTVFPAVAVVLATLLALAGCERTTTPAGSSATGTMGAASGARAGSAP